MRTDFTLYSDSPSVYLASEGLHGRTPSNVLHLVQGTEDLLKQAMHEGLVMPLMMAEEGAYQTRVVVGELSDQEAAEYTGAVAWYLRLTDGRLALSGGLSLFQRDIGGDLVEDFIHTVEVPAGDYAVRVLTFLPGKTAFSNLEKTALKEGFETVGEYWRRTREGFEFPDWLRQHCLEYSEADPGHEAEWEGYADEMDETTSDRVYSANERFVELLIQLVPTAKLPDRFPYLEFGACDWEVRKPATCPTGIEASAEE
jgi:hypothetical protein